MPSHNTDPPDTASIGAFSPVNVRSSPGSGTGRGDSLCPRLPALGGVFTAVYRFVAETMPDSIGAFSPVNDHGGGPSKLPNTDPSDLPKDVSPDIVFLIPH